MTTPLTSRLRRGQRVLLVVEDDPDTAALLKTYFAGYDFEVDTATRGDAGLDLARRRLPDAVLLDIGLPDTDGYAICLALRASPRTSHIPVVFLSERTSLEDRVTGLEAGAHDYITKPFDLEELRLRVHNLIARAARDSLVDPRTGLPTGRWVEEQRQRARGRAGWHTVECRIDAYQTFVDVNGFMAGDDVLHFAGGLVREVIDELGTAEDFAGHPAHDTFLILTGSDQPAALGQRLKVRFDEEVQAFYSFIDREQGFMLVRGADGETVPAPLMTLQISLS